MRKLGGLLLAGTLALTACSAPSEPSSIQPFAAPAPSATVEIAAAPIPAQAESVETVATGYFGDPAADAEYLASVKDGWNGSVPSDSELIAAAKFACQEYATGKSYEEMRPVAGDTNAELDNGVRVAAFAGRVYCTDYSPFAD